MGDSPLFIFMGIIYYGETMNLSLISLIFPGSIYTIILGFILQGVGAPIPFPLLFGLLSNLVVKGQVPPAAAIVYAAAGSLVGNLAGYCLGYAGGGYIIKKTPGWLNRAIDIVSKKGPLAMFVLRWSGGYAQGAWALGMARTPVTIFLLYAALANILWAAFWVLAGKVLIQKLFY